MTHTAEVMRVDDERGVRAVVTHADDKIWIAEELWQDALDPSRERITGDFEIDGDLVSFGTPGEGLGRLTYRMIEFRLMPLFRVCERVPSPPSPGE